MLFAARIDESLLILPSVLLAARMWWAAALLFLHLSQHLLRLPLQLSKSVPSLPRCQSTRATCTSLLVAFATTYIVNALGFATFPASRLTGEHAQYAA